MAELSEVILAHLARNNFAEAGSVVNSVDLAALLGEDHQKVVGAVKSLQSLGDVIHSEQVSSKQWELTDEGIEVAEKGSHEALVFNAVPPQGISQAELMKLLPNAKIGFSKAMSSGWITIDKSAAGGAKVLRKVESIEDVVQKNLLRVRTNDVMDIAESVKLDYKKRKLLQEVVIKSINISRGSEFSTSVTKQETELTPEMIASGSWKEKKFRPYNFDAMGVPPVRGHLHPLMRMRAQFRQIFLEMGFTEMPTNNFIESSFWNFDALFVPQKHPARDVQDTFFVSEPKYAETFPLEYLKRVHKVHEEGDYGSQGYKYKWKMEEARKNVLRTHTTSASARMLHQLAQEKKFRPVKYFSIDRVFRNETLDATHLAEFFQIEGLIADLDLSLGDLIGVLHEFFKKLGITKLRFKPAYNPYTEPSMEIFSFHEGLKKWVEVGNSGVFRPELLRPMGFPKGVTVLGWGLSLERPTMIKFGIDNIRDLEGHKVNLHMVYEAPICRLDKNEETNKKDQKAVPLHKLEVRQESLLKDLRILRTRLLKLTETLSDASDGPSTPPQPVTTVYVRPSDVCIQKDIAIHVSTKHAPLSVLVICRQLSKLRPVSIVTHCCSSRATNIPVENNIIQSLLNGNGSMRLLPSDPPIEPALKVTFIFHSDDDDAKTTLMVSPIQQWKIVGEVNVARYLGRHLAPAYEEDPLMASQIDDWLDLAHESLSQESSIVVKRMQRRLVEPRKYLVGSSLSLADIFVWSTLHQHKSKSDKFPGNVQNWMDQMAQLEDFDLAARLLSPENVRKSGF